MAAHAAGVFWRRPRRWDLRATAIFGWLAGAAVAVAAIHASVESIPLVPWIIALAACGLCAAAFEQVSRRSRRSSQAARLVALFVALAVPALAMYPSLFFLATAAKERLIATTYAPQATSQRKDLQDRLYQALEQIDALPNLADFVSRPVPRHADDRPRVRGLVENRARDLPPHLLRRAVQQRRRSGEPLLAPARTHDPPSRDGELQLGSLRGGAALRLHGAARPAGQPRHLRPRRHSRGDRRAHDARLPDASVLLVPEPVSRAAASGKRTAAEGLQGNDVEFVGYGWSRAPTYVSGTGIWPLPDDAFARAVASREGFWTTLARDDERFRVYLASDRGGIYALGYPALTWFGHLVSLAELIVLAGALYVVLVAGAALFALVASIRPGERPRAAARDPLELLPEAVPRVRRRRRRARRHPRVRRAHVLRHAGSRRRRRGRGQDRDRRAAARRGLRDRAQRPGRARRRSTIRSWCSSAAPSIRT